MRVALPLVLFALLAPVAASAVDAPPAPSGPLGEVLARARDDGRPALVVVEAAWCAQCAQLDAELLGRPESAASFEAYARATVDFDAPDGQAVVARYRIVQLPTALVLEADGSERGRVEGYESPDAFLAALEAIRAGTAAGPDELLAIATANAEDGTGWLALGRRLLLAGDRAEGEWALERAVACDPTGELGVAGSAYELRARLAIRAGVDYDQAVTLLAEARAVLAGTAAIPGLLYWYAEACLAQGDQDSAEMALHGYTAARPYEILPYLLRADFFETHGLDRDQVDRDVGVILSMQPPPDVAAEAYHVRARLRLREGRRSEAKKALEKAIELDPERALYRRALAPL